MVTGFNCLQIFIMSAANYKQFCTWNNSITYTFRNNQLLTITAFRAPLLETATQLTATESEYNVLSDTRYSQPINCHQTYFGVWRTMNLNPLGLLQHKDKHSNQTDLI